MPGRMTARLLEAYADHSFAYASFKPEGRLHIVCPQCRAPVLLFEDLSDEVKTEIAELNRRSPPLAMRALTSAAGCDLAQAKTNVLHLRGKGSGCHRCGAPAPAGALLCSQCLSVNLDW